MLPVGEVSYYLLIYFLLPSKREIIFEDMNPEMLTFTIKYILIAFKLFMITGIYFHFTGHLTTLKILSL